MAAVRPQVAVLVALVALVPVGAMTAFAGVTPLTGLALVNVIIIAASLYYMFGPSPGEAVDHAS